jgi:hypothetical protein
MSKMWQIEAKPKWHHFGMKRKLAQTKKISSK